LEKATSIGQNKSLQKFTQSKTRINNLLSLKGQVTINDFKGLSKPEIGYLCKTIREKINNLEGVERDNFINKIEFLLDDDTKNQLWESNHNNITAAMSDLIHEHRRMPSKNEIAREANLSRQTIHKHLNEYMKHPIYLEHVEHFRFLSTCLLAKVYSYAANGDMGAAKLFFKVMGFLNEQTSISTQIQNQNNYIQINGIMLSQEAVTKMDTEQLKIIENILRTALPETNNNEKFAK
jgi:hypothetical protein